MLIPIQLSTRAEITFFYFIIDNYAFFNVNPESDDVRRAVIQDDQNPRDDQIIYLLLYWYGSARVTLKSRINRHRSGFDLPEKKKKNTLRDGNNFDLSTLPSVPLQIGPVVKLKLKLNSGDYLSDSLPKNNLELGYIQLANHRIKRINLWF